MQRSANSHSNILILSGLALASLISAGSPAAAADRFDGPRTVRVGWRDLDLSSTEGVHAMHLRLRAAARVVCGDRDPRRLNERQQVARCKRDAYSRGLASIEIVTATPRRVTARVE